MSEKDSIQQSSSSALFSSLKETFALGTQEFAKSVGTIFYTNSSKDSLDKNQISHELDSWEKALQKSRI